MLCHEHQIPPDHLPDPIMGAKLTETREIAPYRWVHPDEER